MAHETRQSLEKDGYRAWLSVDGARVQLVSRRGTDLSAAFPEIVAGAAQLSDGTAVDGEIVVWEADRLAFERLQHRMQRRGTSASQAGRQAGRQLTSGRRTSSPSTSCA
jgi:bifunctional non-homologous end joining protein LigD